MNGCSIIICAHNSRKVIRDTLISLANQEVDFPVELIFVDNASSDGTAKYVEQIWQTLEAPFPLHLLVEKRPGQSFAVSKGFQETKYELIVFVDDDNRLQNNYIKNAFQLFIERPRLGVAGGVLEPEFEVDPPFWFEEYKALFAIGYMKPLDDAPTEHSIYGAGMCLRSTAWQSILDTGYRPQVVGRSGEKLSSGSDFEICKLIKLAGWDLLSCSQLRMKHFMTKERLNWSYLLKLREGISSSYIEIIALQNAIVWKYGSFWGRILTSWWVYRIKKQLKDGMLTIRKGTPKEGNANYVAWLQNRTELNAIKRGKRKYELMLKQFTNPGFIRKISIDGRE